MNAKFQFFLNRLKNYHHWSNKIEVAQQSVFDCTGHLLNIRILVKGVDNRLEISEQTRIFNYDIVIKGSGNSLEIENDCAANGNHIFLTMWNEGD